VSASSRPQSGSLREPLCSQGHNYAPVRKPSINDLAERGIELTPEQRGRIRSASENDHRELLIELHEDLAAWAAVEVVVALAASGPDEISCVAPSLICLWWD
jgi:hypothetical protein